MVDDEIARARKARIDGALAFQSYWIDRIRKDRGLTAVGTERWKWLDALADHIEMIDAAAVIDSLWERDRPAPEDADGPERR